MAKHIDQLGTIEDYNAPWETAAGETEIDKGRLKKFLFGLLSDKAKAQDARDEALEKIETAEKERDKAKAEAAEKDPDSAGKIAKLEKENADLKSEISKRDTADLAKEVAREKGLTDKQAAYLTGTTQEELEKSADKFIEDNGLTVNAGEDDDQNDDDEPQARRTPKVTLNPADPKDGGGPEKVVDYEKIVAGFDNSPFRT